MKTATTSKKSLDAMHFTPAIWMGNFNRPWHTTDIVAGNLILDWHGHEVARVESAGKCGEELRATRDMIIKAVNVYEAAMKVVNLMALMKHTCKSKPKKVYVCARCLAEIAQKRDGVR